MTKIIKPHEDIYGAHTRLRQEAHRRAGLAITESAGVMTDDLMTILDNTDLAADPAGKLDTTAGYVTNMLDGISREAIAHSGMISGREVYVPLALVMEATAVIRGLSLQARAAHQRLNVADDAAYDAAQRAHEAEQTLAAIADIKPDEDDFTPEAMQRHAKGYLDGLSVSEPEAA